jgi:hypothetical protein
MDAEMENIPNHSPNKNHNLFVAHAIEVEVVVVYEA